MKFLMALSLLFPAPRARGDLLTEIPGNWRYDGFFYQGYRYPNPNPHLTVLFTFNADHTARLYWKRDDENGFCERKGEWNIDGDQLVQKATWINPGNQASCGSDPDMQPGRQTSNRIEIDGSQLNLHMQLDGRDFIYILIKQPSQTEMKVLSQPI